jgi:hypothetical protein
MLGASLATFTVSVSGGKLKPELSTLLRVHGPAGWVQDQPVPLTAVAVKPLGSVSVTVTVPDVGPLPLLVTVMA